MSSSTSLSTAASRSPVEGLGRARDAASATTTILPSLAVAPSRSRAASSSDEENEKDEDDIPVIGSFNTQNRRERRATRLSPIHYYGCCKGSQQVRNRQRTAQQPNQRPATLRRRIFIQTSVRPSVRRRRVMSAKIRHIFFSMR